MEAPHFILVCKNENWRVEKRRNKKKLTEQQKGAQEQEELVKSTAMLCIRAYVE